MAKAKNCRRSTQIASGLVKASGLLAVAMNTDQEKANAMLAAERGGNFGPLRRLRR